MDGPEQKVEYFSHRDTDTYMGQVITQATQLLVPIRAVFIRTFVVFLRFIFPLTRRGCFQGCGNCTPTDVRRDEARVDGMLKMAF